MLSTAARPGRRGPLPSPATTTSDKLLVILLRYFLGVAGDVIENQRQRAALPDRTTLLPMPPRIAIICRSTSLYSCESCSSCLLSWLWPPVAVRATKRNTPLRP